MSGTSSGSAPGLPLYRAYGLTIASEFVLPAPREADLGRAADLTVRAGPLLDPPGAAVPVAAVSPLLRLVFRARDCWEVHGSGYDPRQRYTARVQPGRIDVGWSPGVLPEDVARHLVGLVLAAYAYVQGGVCLHGCAVATGASAALILGDSGRGKSTLAAALVADGARLVSEEIVLLGADALSVVPGTPAVKLSARIADLLGLRGRARPAYAHPDFGHEGLVVDFDDGGPPRDGDVAVGEVLLLGERHGGARPVLSAPLTAAAAAAALAGSVYWMAHLPLDARRAGMGAVLEIARRRPVRRLNLPDDPAALPEAARLIRGCAAPSCKLVQPAPSGRAEG